MKRYWIGTMNRVIITEDIEMPSEQGWREVSKEVYEEAYRAAWDNACNSGIWHC